MKVNIPIKPQPDETTCGPTCLHSIYQYYQDPIALQEVIDEVLSLEDGGTLGALLAHHALKRGFKATIYSYNLQVFDPSWFTLEMDEIQEKLKEQLKFKDDRKLKIATEAYLKFLENGGKLRFEDLRSMIIRRYLKKGQPVIAGLSATYLYGSKREYGPNLDYDDIRGEPTGHFVVLYGYDMETRMVSIADPLNINPLNGGQFYQMKIDRVVNAILLGIVTYDANLIIISPKKAKAAK
jgi:hypothetical protein